MSLREEDEHGVQDILIWDENGKYFVFFSVFFDVFLPDIVDESILIMEENNKKLTIWTTVFGDFNSHGLRSHAPIKLRERKPQSARTPL